LGSPAFSQTSVSLSSLKFNSRIAVRYWCFGISAIAEYFLGPKIDYRI
jgi:hypothetical protein